MASGWVKNRIIGQSFDYFGELTTYFKAEVPLYLLRLFQLKIQYIFYRILKWVRAHYRPSLVAIILTANDIADRDRAHLFLLYDIYLGTIYKHRTKS